jgi:hypothetical protein
LAINIGLVLVQLLLGLHLGQTAIVDLSTQIALLVADQTLKRDAILGVQSWIREALLLQVAIPQCRLRDSVSPSVPAILALCIGDLLCLQPAFALRAHVVRARPLGLLSRKHVFSLALTVTIAEAACRALGNG